MVDVVERFGLILPSSHAHRVPILRLKLAVFGEFVMPRTLRSGTMSPDGHVLPCIYTHLDRPALPSLDQMRCFPFSSFPR